MVLPSIIESILNWFRSLFWKQEMELTLVGLQNSGKTTLVNVIAVCYYTHLTVKQYKCATFHKLEAYIFPHSLSTPYLRFSVQYIMNTPIFANTMLQLHVTPV